MAGKKKAKKKRRLSSVQRRSRRGLIQVAEHFRVYVDGGIKQYRRLCACVRWYRALFTKMLGHVSAAQAATAELVMHKPTKNLILVPNSDRAREVLAALFSKSGKRRYYELRGCFFQAVRELEAQGGPYFGSHMWDGICGQLAAVRDKKMPAFNGLWRSRLEIQGRLDVPSCRHLGMPVMRTCGRNYTNAIEDERGKRFRIQIGRRGDVFDLVVEGTVATGDGEFRKELNAGQSRDFHKFATGDWEFQTPVLNLHEDGTLSLNVPYSRPKKVASDIRKDNVMEVCFKAVKGSDLPARRHERGTDDDKVYVIHCFKQGGRRKFRIPVNDVLADMNRYSAKRHKIEIQRDCRRRWPARTKRPLAERIHHLTELRSRRQKDANHAWTREIIRQAGFWCCGTIKVFGLPNGVTEGLLLDQSIQWQWSQFAQFLAYKANEAGMVVKQIVRSNLVEDLRKKVS